MERGAWFEWKRRNRKTKTKKKLSAWHFCLHLKKGERERPEIGRLCVSVFFLLAGCLSLCPLDTRPRLTALLRSALSRSQPAVSPFFFHQQHPRCPLSAQPAAGLQYLLTLLEPQDESEALKHTDRIATLKWTPLFETAKILDCCNGMKFI